MKVILSIKPEFAEKIFDGEKRFEFRRSLFKKPEVQSVVVYASAPISKVIGEFEIEEILFDDLNDLWTTTEQYAGISSEYYYQYFHGKDKGYAIKIKAAKRYKQSLSIQENFGIRPPQSFAYLRS